jgi:ABC-type nitrate/sulfonate/bicarbonate transport system substrate-binding protein
MQNQNNNFKNSLKINRRKLLISMGLTLAGIPFLKTPIYAKHVKNPIKIGIVSPSHCALPIILADHRKYYKKFAGNVELIFKKGTSQVAKGLLNGELNFGQIIVPLSFAIHSGHPKFPKNKLAVTQILGSNGGVLAISANQKIKSLKELKGKKIGIHNPYLIHSLILNMVLRRSKIDPQKDISLKIIPFNLMDEALKNGEIDAIIHPEPLPSLLEAQKITKTLLTTHKIWLNHPCCALVCTKKLLSHSPQMIKDVTLASTIAGLELSNSVYRKNAISEIHTSYSKFIKAPLKVLNKAFRPRHSDFYPFPYKSSAKIIVNELSHQNLLHPTTNTEELINEVFQYDIAMNSIKLAAEQTQATCRVPLSFSRTEKFIYDNKEKKTDDL